MPGYEKRLNASARSIDPGQSRQSTQADLGQNFLLLSNFLHVQEPVSLVTHLVDSHFKCITLSQTNLFFYMSAV